MKIFFIALLVVPVVILIIAGIVLIPYAILRKKGSGTDGSKGDTKPPPKTDQKETTEKKEVSKIKESSGSAWKPILGLALGIGFLLWAGSAAYKNFSSPTTSSIISRTPTTNLSHSAPVEIARLVICGCESNCQQFESGTKIPLKNKERESSAFGKYQFLESHREPAKKLGFDLDTEDGQDSYFAHLYNESGTRHWEADPRSVACWESKLRAYTWGGSETISIVVKAPTDKWSDMIPLPRNGGHYSLDSFGKKYAVRWNNGRQDEVEENLPALDGVAKRKSVIDYDFRLKSREPEAVPVLVKFF